MSRDKEKDKNPPSTAVKSRRVPLARANGEHATLARQGPFAMTAPWRTIPSPHGRSAEEMDHLFEDFGVGRSLRWPPWRHGRGRGPLRPRV